MVTVNRLDIITFIHDQGIMLAGQVMSNRFTFSDGHTNPMYYVVTPSGAEFLVCEGNILTARPMAREAKGI